MTIEIVELIPLGFLGQYQDLSAELTAMNESLALSAG